MTSWQTGIVPHCLSDFPNYVIVAISVLATSGEFKTIHRILTDTPQLKKLN